MSTDIAGSRTLPAILEKIGTLDKWITSRMEETNAAEARINNKLDQLSKLEVSLQAMIDGLRKQVTDTLPVLSEIRQTRDKAQSVVDQAVEDALAAARQKVNHLEHEAADRIDAQIKSRVAEALSSVTVDQMGEIARDVHKQLTDEADHCREQAEQTLIMFRQLLQKQVDQVVDQAAAASNPHLSKLSDARSYVDAQVEATLAAAQESIEQRMTNLSRSAQATVELIEQGLVDRVRNIRPQVMNEVESTQKMIAYRVAGLIEASRKMVSTVVNELDDKLESLSPRTDAVRDELEARLTRYMKDLQDSAETMVGWLEDRVTQRVDDLVEQSRSSIKGEIRALDRASDKLANSVPVDPMPAVENPGEPLSLTMYIDRMRTAPGPKPAA